MSVTSNWPVRVPAAVGANTIVTLQLVFAASVLGKMGQVLEEATEKSPLALIEFIKSDVGWLFVSVIVLVALFPIFTLEAKVSDVGANTTGLIPVPFRVDVTADPKALYATVRVPVVAMAEDGVKMTLMEQVAPAANMLVGAGQSLVWLKLALVPIEVMVRGTFWTFLSVKDFAELLKPSGTFPKL